MVSFPSSSYSKAVVGPLGVSMEVRLPSGSKVTRSGPRPRVKTPYDPSAGMPKAKAASHTDAAKGKDRAARLPRERNTRNSMPACPAVAGA